MATVITKKIKGNIYFYAVETARVNGVSRIVKQIYLGTPQNLLERLGILHTPEKPKEVYSREFGSIAAVLSIEEQLGARAVIDSFVRKRSQGLSPGTYMVLAAINRCVELKSKLQFSEWASDTSLPRLLGFSSSQVTSQHFWNHMTMIPEESLPKIYAAIADRIIDRFNVDTDLLAFDSTNFFTFIDTNNPSDLAKRGHNKAKRNDLKQVSLALLASMDGNVPLFFDVYPGNISDSEEFAKVMKRLVDQYYIFFRECRSVTLVYDKGNNSEDNLKAFYDTEFNFVGSLVLSHHKDLYEIPLSDFERIELNDGDEIYAYRTRKEIFGEEKTVVIVWNEELYTGQMQGIANNINKSIEELKALSKMLMDRATGKQTKGRRPTNESVLSNINRILNRQYVKRLIDVVISKDENGHILINYSQNDQELEKLKAEELGRTILFTDRDDWNTEAIIKAYRGQYHAEHAFRDMKSHEFISFSPMYHRTDHNIEIHAFYCVLAYTYLCLLHRKVLSKGLSMSKHEMMTQLSKIREVMLLYAPRRGKKPEIVCQIEAMTDEQKALFDLLELSRYEG